MKTANLFLAALLTAVAPLAALGEAEKPITLDNGVLQVELGRNGLEKTHDKTTGKTAAFVSDSFSVLVDGREIESTRLTPAVKKENDSAALGKGDLQ